MDQASPAAIAGGNLHEKFSHLSVPTEKDLVKLKEEHPSMYQQGRTTKGAISLTEQGQKNISLFESADQSTFVHEMAHMFLLDLQEVAGIDRNNQQAKDLDTTMKCVIRYSIFTVSYYLNSTSIFLDIQLFVQGH